jgi:hypothetical protein
MSVLIFRCEPAAEKNTDEWAYDSPHIEKTVKVTDHLIRLLSTDPVMI